MPERLAPRSGLHALHVAWRLGGELVHVSAIYLGLAVLTTLVLGAVLPSMRSQSQQLHQAVLAMFEADDAGAAPSDAAWSTPARLPPVAASTDSNHVTTPGTAEASTTPARAPVLTADNLNFSRALLASERGAPIAGVSNAQARALRSYLGRKYQIADVVAGALIRTAFIIGPTRELDPQLLLAVVAIESRYNPFAASAVGAQGLMQIMTSVHRDKLEASGGDVSVFNPVVNMRVGAQILADCIQRRGSVQGGLACYVGATGPGDGGYAARVLAERRRIALASGITPRAGARAD